MWRSRRTKITPPFTVGYWRIARLIYSRLPPTILPLTAGTAALATAPPAAGDPAGYVFGSEFVVYRGTDNHVDQLFAAANQGPWSHADLTAITNAHLAVGNPSGYVNGGTVSGLSGNGQRYPSVIQQWYSVGTSGSEHIRRRASCCR